MCFFFCFFLGLGLNLEGAKKKDAGVGLAAYRCINITDNRN